MDAEKKYYKVVRKRNKQIFSAITRGKARVRYLSNQWVCARKWVLENAGNYQLVVFKDLDKAIAWARARRDTTGLAVYECKILHPRTRSKMPHRLFTSSLNRGYFNKAEGDNWPNGTIMAKAVCLTKQVWDVRSLEGECGGSKTGAVDLKEGDLVTIPGRKDFEDGVVVRVMRVQDIYDNQEEFEAWKEAYGFDNRSWDKNQVCTVHVAPVLDYYGPDDYDFSEEFEASQVERLTSTDPHFKD